MPTRRHLLLATPALLAAPALAQPAFDHTIRIIVPFAPGGTSDILARILAPELTKQLGQSVVVENRPGAAGNLGADAVAKAAPDGHTILLIDAGILATAPSLFTRLPFDVRRDLAPATMLIYAPYILAVHPSLPAKDAAELTAYAKANPGKVTYGTPGVGSTLHITMERIAEQLGIEWVHVPFRGGADNSQALLAGQITATADSTGWAPLVHERRFRLLVTWGVERARRFPDTPTLKETGIDIVATSPYGLGGPKGIDPGVVRVLHDAFKAALLDPAHVSVLDRFDMPVLYMGTEEYAAFARRLHEEEAAAVRRLGLRMD